MRSGYVLLRSACGPGVNLRLHDTQRQSWMISSFFSRTPLRVTLRLPQCEHASGCFVVRGACAMRGNECIREVRLTVSCGAGLGTVSSCVSAVSRKLESEGLAFCKERPVVWSKRGSRILSRHGLPWRAVERPPRALLVGRCGGSLVSEVPGRVVVLGLDEVGVDFGTEGGAECCDEGRQAVQEFAVGE